ncbi:transmembrane protein, putative [Bodo saltans]|uniref:Transmembrane protein, putative n=1 Tax=Bodo saltans TaxID=75058 RepID=A0A0S4JJW8_BODSA|nr:transmembrane protein, putative [Bodo saltans]|eukprot:CUG90554.1 transmembrane protein, putative [Bodo saltans]
MTAAVSSLINPSNPRCVAAPHQYHGDLRQLVGSWSATGSKELSRSSFESETTSLEHLTPSPTTQPTAATRTYAITALPMLLASHSPTVSQDNIRVSKTILLEASSALLMTHRHGRADSSVTAAINGTTSFGPETQTMAMPNKTQSVLPSRTSSKTALGSNALLLRSPTMTNNSYVKSSTLLVNHVATFTSRSRTNAKVTTTSSAVAAAVSVAGLTATLRCAALSCSSSRSAPLTAKAPTAHLSPRSSARATATSSRSTWAIRMILALGTAARLVSSIVLALGAAFALTLVVAVRWRLHAPHDIAELRYAAAHMEQPGWWLAGPFAIAAAPLFSSSLSLISTSIVVGSSASDTVLITASLVLFTVPFGMSFRALLQPAFGGWFIASTRGPTYDEEGVRGWIVGGGMRWGIDVRVASRDHAASSFLHAYGSLFMSMRPHRHWWFLVDMSTSVVVALLAALPTLVVHRDDAATLVPNLCTGALHASTAVQMLFMLAFVVLRPVAIRWEHAAALLQVVLGALSALLTSLTAAGVDGLDDSSNGVAIAQTVIMVVALVGGLVDDGMSVLTSRPTRRARLVVNDTISARQSLAQQMNPTLHDESRHLQVPEVFLPIPPFAVEEGDTVFRDDGAPAGKFAVDFPHTVSSSGRNTARALKYLISCCCVAQQSRMRDAMTLAERHTKQQRAS